MTSREQFEAWLKNELPAISLTVNLPLTTGGYVKKQPFYTAYQMHEAWQASRAQALEDAALVCSQHNHAWIAADAIREMKE